MAKPVCWPVSDDAALIGCNAEAIIKLVIAEGVNNAPFSEGADSQPSIEDIAFWGRVRAERGRIAQWVVSGLGISGPAVDAASLTTEDSPATETTADIVRRMEGQMPDLHDPATDLIRASISQIYAEIPTIKRVSRFHDVLTRYKRVLSKENTSEGWEAAYNIIFSGVLGEARDYVFKEMNLETPNYDDPDMGYEDDVVAWLDAQIDVLTAYRRGYEKIQEVL